MDIDFLCQGCGEEINVLCECQTTIPSDIKLVVECNTCQKRREIIVKIRDKRRFERILKSPISYLLGKE